MAKIAVAVLVVIAIAGIVLATLQRGLPDEGPVAGDPTQPASGAMTGASAVAAAADGAPNEVIFPPDSVELSSAAKAKLASLAEQAKNDKQRLTIVARVEFRGEGRPQREELARSRAIAVRGLLEANGVALSNMETRIEKPSFGLAAPKDANRIEVNPR